MGRRRHLGWEQVPPESTTGDLDPGLSEGASLGFQVDSTCQPQGGKLGKQDTRPEGSELHVGSKDVWGLPGGASGKELACQCRRHERHGFNPWVGKIPWRRAWQPMAVFLPGKFHGQRSLGGYGPWGLKEPGTTGHAHGSTTRKPT